ncbi:MAG: hypothetical protein AAGD06_25235 [Acidobacteriota bacterium]
MCRASPRDTYRSVGPRLEVDLTGDFSATAGRFGCVASFQPRVECGQVQRIAIP